LEDCCVGLNASSCSSFPSSFFLGSNDEGDLSGAGGGWVAFQRSWGFPVCLSILSPPLFERGVQVLKDMMCVVVKDGVSLRRMAV